MDRPTPDAAEVRLLDEIAAAATPATSDEVIEGWWCKASPDLPFRRAGAVLPPVTAGRDPEADRAALAAVRARCATAGRRLLVQVPDGLDDGLDRLLAAEGLAVEAPVEVLATTEAGLSTLAAGHRAGSWTVQGTTVEVAVGVDERWSRGAGTILGATDRDRVRAEGYGRMLAVVGDQALGASAPDPAGGGIVGVGYGVVDRSWLGVFGMVTAPAHRRRGVARAVLAALAAAGEDRGARRAYLQVETDNDAALALYAELGFTHHHRYHYRSLPSPEDGGARPLRSGPDAGGDCC